MTTSEHVPEGSGAAAPEMGARKPRFTLRPVTRPLSGPTGSLAGTQAKPRAENEDDDGYDPYSDYHDGTAGALEFERDPWR